MLLGSGLLQELFLIAPGTIGTYQLIGYYVSIIAVGEEFQKPALFWPCYLLQPRVPGADSDHRTYPPLIWGVFGLIQLFPSPLA